MSEHIFVVPEGVKPGDRVCIMLYGGGMPQMRGEIELHVSLQRREVVESFERVGGVYRFRSNEKYPVAVSP